ncbi:MAG TPA: 2,3-bisphosphoglycerate-independent phosphoglycerate mutase [Nitrospirales bacterium]
MNPPPKSVALIILDGWGENPNPEANAIAQAHLPFYRSLLKQYPHTLLSASGEDTGLPDNQMGNSEVGHMNIGAGRIVYQDFTRINRAIRDGSFASNPVLNETMRKTRAAGGRLHLLGLLSDGGVHSHIAHLYALLRMAKLAELPVFVHAFLDGRDTPPQSGLGYVREVASEMQALKVGTIASVIGRYYAMDRDNRWERVEKAYRALVEGEGERRASAEEAVLKSYEAKVTDEFILPAIIAGNESSPSGTIRDGDGVIFYNFRADRARELTRALTDAHFSGFPRRVVPKLSAFATMTSYDDTFPIPTAFGPTRLTRILAEIISELGLNQLRIAETEKYAHVTYFFNGGDEKSYPGEDRVLIPSPRDVPTYDLKPQMSAREVAKEVSRRIGSGKYSLIVVNFANPDMVGHTGILKAAIQAAEVIDDCLKEVISSMQDQGGASIITADHGNLEQMVDYVTGEPYTAHTLNPVPCIVVDDRPHALRPSGVLADIAPTILKLMDIPQPLEMTGVSLIKE